jgi:uncharacterized protein (DUF302 family)
VSSRGAPLATSRQLERLLALLHERDIEVFAVIDHSGEAARVGQELPDTKLVVFGNPAVGTALMQAAPLAGLDLPLKILVWAHGTETLVSTNAPAHFAERYGLSDEQANVLAAAGAIADAVAGISR